MYFGVAFLIVLYIMAASHVKRAHDVGKSHIFALVFFVPIIGWIVTLYLLFKKGMDGVNKFGPPLSGVGKMPDHQESFNNTNQHGFISKSISHEEIAIDLHEKPLDDAKFYEIIGNEIASGLTDVSTWTEAYSMAEGDDIKTKVIYIKLRLNKLKNTQVADN
jgi:hypothetical protein